MTEVKICKNTGKEILVRSEEDDQNGFSFLDIIRKTDNLPDDYIENNNFINNNIILYSHDESFIFGYMLLSSYNKIMANTEMKKHFDNLFLKMEHTNECSGKSLILKSLNSSSESYNDLFDTFSLAAKKSMVFECTKGWRNEKYTIHKKDKTPYFMLERAVVAIFGILTFGIHVNGYFYDSNSKLRMWIPRRSKTKATWPLKLDNVVAGGLGNGDGVDKTLWKELKEEANLDRSSIENNIKMVGCLSYFYFDKDLDKCKFDLEEEVITSELEFIYDLEFPKDVVPKINDAEVHEFKHYSLQELVTLLKSNDFKPNCSLVVVDFLIRHGYINITNEPYYSELLLKIHRKLPFTSL